ncbi:MarR family winged helix-turn-helix transcriptional regulator [Sphingosinithalassobacter sp. CS137]|uniref:MarR family winged helix-turn-helix transcriptional regulator n=1 Tax=Sphingosinithalassobacter sp. CS137 TaxID=2762748 RepID=UPI00165E90CE|nr:MarR family transcriptional regulator [Sphingosinithalassobacter sp. CS137]
MASEVTLGELDSILGLRIRRAHGAVQRHFTDHFAELGLTQKQVSVLWLAGNHPGLAQTDLARALDTDRATTMALVHGLEKRGLLARTASSQPDRRRIAFQLTADGARLLERSRAAIAAHEAWLAARFTSDELVQLHALLARIYR